MYSEQLKSKIAQFLAMQTDHMRVIRDNIPSGPEHFHFYHNEVEIDWYAFWDRIADHKPIGVRMETYWYVIFFSDASLDWHYEMKVQGEQIESDVEKVLSHLRIYEIRAQSVRNWIRYNNK